MAAYSKLWSEDLKERGEIDLSECYIETPRSSRSQKRGACVGKTKRGKGTKLMAFSDGSSSPLALHAQSASPHEVTLVEATLASAFLKEQPKRLIGDKAYDPDPLDETLLERGIEMIAPHRREKPKEEKEPGWAQAASLQEEVEDREALRVASKLQEVGRLLRIQGRELPGHGATWVHRRDSAQKVFVRWLLVRPDQ